MEKRILGRGGFPTSVVGLGTWQLGADWGDVSEGDALAVLDAAYEAGITFFDTADVYGDGRSEQLIAAWRATHPHDQLHVATKMGRRMDQVPENYCMENFRTWADRSRKNLAVDTLELVQLHCPPSAVFHDDEVFDALDTLVEDEVIARYGVSVETVEQALAAMERPNVVSIQIIVNAFRLKPLEQVIPRARQLGVGVIARVPLASGLLTGKYTKDTTFAANDHRNFNRHGESFDVGETFSGVDFELGVEAAQKFSALAERFAPATTAQVALAWLIAQGITTVIPGARSPEQARANAAAASVQVDEQLNQDVKDLYDRYFRADIHQHW